MIDLSFRQDGAPYWDLDHWQGNPATRSRCAQFVDRRHKVFGTTRTFRAECSGPSDSWPQASGGSGPRSLFGAWTGNSSWYPAPKPTIPYPKPGERLVAAVAIEIEPMGGLLPVGTLWELHHSNQLGTMAPVAPLSVYAYTDGYWHARLGGGEGKGGGWQTYWNGDYMRLAPLKTGLHLFVYDVKYSKGNDGYIDVYYALDQDDTFAKVLSRHTGEPTWPWGAGLPDEKLYQEIGIYPDGSMAQRQPGQNQVYHYGTQEWFNATDADLAAALACFHLDDGQAQQARPVARTRPTVNGTLIAGKTLYLTNGEWLNGPTSYAYQWQYTRDAGASWADVKGATQTTFLAADTFVGCSVRAVVTATNPAGATSSTSDPTGAIAAEPAPAVVYLDEFWTDAADASLYKRWATDNPGEHATLQAYGQNPVVPPPPFATAAGRMFADAIAARVAQGLGPVEIP